MDPLKPFRELLERRLWPVAVLLVAALAAVPLLLSRSPETQAPPTASVTTTVSDVEPVVDAADPATRDAARKVIGKAKDPFRAAGVIKVKAKAEATGKAKTKQTSDPQPSSTPSQGGGGGGETPAATPAPTVTPAPTTVPEPAFPLQSLEVRFGTVEEPDHARRTLTRLSGLPKGTTPALLYLGLLKDRKTAVFLVDDRVTVLGDGTCRPSPDNCETLRMKKGDIEFVGTPDGGQYQVEVLAVHNRRTSSANVARTSRTRTARGGKRWLRRMGGHSLPLRYDAHSGTLARK